MGTEQSVDQQQQQQQQPLPQSGLAMRQQQQTAGIVRSDSTSSQVGREALSSGRDFLSSVSSELNGLAAQTSSLFGGLFGSKNSNRGQSNTAPQPFRLHNTSSTSSTESNQRSKERQPPFGPFPRSSNRTITILLNYFSEIIPKLTRFHDSPPCVQRTAVV